jgi:hypothetical protein
MWFFQLAQRGKALGVLAIGLEVREGCGDCIVRVRQQPTDLELKEHNLQWGARGGEGIKTGHSDEQLVLLRVSPRMTDMQCTHELSVGNKTSG